MEQKLQYEKDDMNTFSKVLGLCYLKTTAFLFLLEARFEELVCKESLEIVPKYFLYSKRFQMGSKIQIFDLFNHVLSFYVDYVPKDEPVTTLTPYRPTISVPLTNWKAVKVLAAEEATSKPKYSGRLRQNKKVVAAVEEEHADRFTYIVKSQTFIKNVSKEELHVITKLLSLDTYTIYLPKILKIYRNGDVEFELLTAIHIHNEEDLLALTIDVCKALKFLHKMNIVHRDVKPSNIMLRRFDHPKNYYWFVLIDFGLSFHFERTDHGLVDSYSHSLATENAGTHLFKAPEVIAMEAYDERIDIFSLGSTILSLTDQKRFLTTRAKQGNLQDMVGQLNWKYPTFKHVVFDMLSEKSEDRPSASTIVDLLTPVALDCEKYC
ncbi:hypothetical protein C9374_007538 [Naegleria lovaniensis]|nr:uncharacterized protein C9374_007538 [Naegleria lovaniensis]KAG2379399.1 hypothetical protein C9374_007538 [Naegleria lovaniensis]